VGGGRGKFMDLLLRGVVGGNGEVLSACKVLVVDGAVHLHACQVLMVEHVRVDDRYDRVKQSVQCEHAREIDRQR